MISLQVDGLAQAFRPLLDPVEQRDCVSKIAWPSAISATHNFYCAVNDYEASYHGRLRQIGDVAILQDSSMVALSHRESEYLLRADRKLRQQGKLAFIKVAITSLDFLRWLHPAAAAWPWIRSTRSARTAVVPLHAFGGSLTFCSAPQYENLAMSVVAAQLFNGETDYEQKSSLSKAESDLARRDQLRKRVLKSLLFHTTADAHTTNAIVAGAKQVVQARQRGVYWKGSLIESVCMEEEDRLQFKDAQTPS